MGTCEGEVKVTGRQGRAGAAWAGRQGDCENPYMTRFVIILFTRVSARTNLVMRKATIVLQDDSY